MYNLIVLILIVPSLFLIVNALNFEVLNRKPFNCELCFSFWGALIISCIKLDYSLFFIIFIASIFIIKKVNEFKGF